eukprot:scaffold130116_cov63-Phaeocystis_antarctica.AAC.1
MAPLPLSPKDCSKGVPLSPNWMSPASVKQRILPSVFTTRSPFRIESPEPSAPQRSWRTLGHFDASSSGGGEGGGDGGDWGGTGQAVWQTYFNVVAQLLSFHVPPVDLSCMQSSPLP